jgi:hypothetical protein
VICRTGRGDFIAPCVDRVKELLDIAHRFLHFDVNFNSLSTIMFIRQWFAPCTGSSAPNDYSGEPQVAGLSDNAQISNIVARAAEFARSV